MDKISNIYLVLIVLPALILFILAFIFQSSVQAISKQQFLLNCPLPISNGVITFGNPAIVDGLRLNYTVNTGGSYQAFGSSNYNGTYFDCYLDHLAFPPDNPTAIAITKNYGATLFSVIPYGWYAWVGDSVSVFVGKVQPFLTMVYLMFTAPAQVTGLVWFTYAQVFMLFLIGLGIFMAVRGS